MSLSQLAGTLRAKIWDRGWRGVAVLSRFGWFRFKLGVSATGFSLTGDCSLVQRALLVLCLLLAALPLRAGELKVTTWNLEWLTEKQEGDHALPRDVRPKTHEDMARLRAYADRVNADVFGFQEVDGAAVAARIFPADRYVIHITQDQTVQRVGFAVRRGLVFTANPDLVGLSLPDDGGRRLRSGADITVQTPGGFLRLLNVHLKTGCNRDSLNSRSRPQCETLRAQLAPMQGWIAERQRELVPYVILGDFNRQMDRNDQFQAGLQQSGPLVRATESKSNPCWGGAAFIDHILAGGPARGWMKADSLRVLVYREQGREWRDRLSDHCPVSVTFQLPG